MLIHLKTYFQEGICMGAFFKNYFEGLYVYLGLVIQPGRTTNCVDQLAWGCSNLNQMSLVQVLGMQMR